MLRLACPPGSVVDTGKRRRGARPRLPIISPQQQDNDTCGAADLRALSTGTAAASGGAGNSYGANNVEGQANDKVDEEDVEREQSYSSSPNSGGVAIDTTDMSVDQVLQLIRVPKLSSYSCSSGITTELYDPHIIGHLNHLIKCLSNSLFEIPLPDNVVGKSNLVPVDFLHVYFFCVSRMFPLFKSLDTVDFCDADQKALFESSILKVLVCMSCYAFRKESNSWHIPSSRGESSPAVLKPSDLNQILPYNVLQETLSINLLSTNLQFDLPIVLLCVVAFFYTPLNIEVQQISLIDKLQQRYMEILLKYLKSKHGFYNASVMFPEILKLMDAILKHCNKVENIVLTLKDEEIDTLENLIKPQRKYSSNAEEVDSKANLILEDTFYTGITLAKINRRISNNCFLHISQQEVWRNAGCDTVREELLPQQQEEASRRKLEEILFYKYLQHNKDQQSSPLSLVTSNSVATDLRKGGDEKQVVIDKYPANNMQIVAFQKLLMCLTNNEHSLKSGNREETTTNPLPFHQNRHTNNLDNVSPTDNRSQSPHSLILQSKLLHEHNILRSKHLVNFAKSLDHHRHNQQTDEKYSNEGVTLPSILHPGDGADTDSAIDLSRGSRWHRSEATTFTTNSSIMNTSTTRGIVSKEVPALKPLISLKNFESQEFDSELSSSPGPSPIAVGEEAATRRRKEGAEDLMHGHQAYPTPGVLPTAHNNNNINDISESDQSKAQPTPPPSSEELETTVSSPQSLTRTQLELLFDFLGRSRYKDDTETS